MLFRRNYLVRQTTHFFLILVFATFLFIVGNEGLRSPALAQRQPHYFYVAPDGSDTNEGSMDHPWATVNHAAHVLMPGDTVYIRGGTYPLTEQIRAKHSGTQNRWVIYRAFPKEQVILDANRVKVAPPSGQPPFPHDQGAFQLENVQYIQVKGVEIINSHNSGITVRNSHHIHLYNNKTRNTFSPGIGVWNSDHQKVIGNTVINANAPEMAGFPNNLSETPHEAISMGGVESFEVAYNLVYDGKKEGIDVKENSKHGTVHHNYVHHMARQALYVDSWFGELEDVEIFDNVAHDCKGAGFAISVEGATGSSVARNIRFHHNLLYNNWGTGIFFSRWGHDGLREKIRIYNNTVYHNGHGQPNPGEDFYWITGGLYLFSENLNDLDIRNNIFSQNAGFKIGYSQGYLRTNSNIEQVLRQKNIDITHNLVFGTNSVDRPIYAGWSPNNYVNIYATNGTSALVHDPQFVSPESGNFSLLHSSIIDPTRFTSSTNRTQTTVGAFPPSEVPNLWWQTNFPPEL